MAKAKPATKPKANAAKKTKEDTAKQTVAEAPESATASVGPVEGTLEANPDEVNTPTPKGKKGKFGGVSADFGQRFDDLAAALAATNKEKKQPRQLRWALKALDAAKDAALRHIQHNA